MPKLNKQAVVEFERIFQEWKGFFGNPRQRPPDQKDPYIRKIKRIETKEEMEEKFKEMVEKNNF